MGKCRLCRRKEADKKGSHIIPHFLLKRVENIEGKTGRDYELGFNLAEGFGSSHFGRSVPPEKLEDVYGEVTEDDLERNSNNLIQDYFFCSECEEKFSVIESAYAKTLEKSDNVAYDSGIQAEIGMLFWGGVIWRMSENGKSGVKLTEEESEKLRCIINEFQCLSMDDINLEHLRETLRREAISYKLLRCTENLNDCPKWLILHPKLDKPYCLFIADYVVAFSFGDKYQDLESIDALGINDDILEAKINKVGFSENIQTFSKEHYFVLNKRCLEEMLKSHFSYRNKILDMFHAYNVKRDEKMPEDLKIKIFQNLFSEENKLGRQHTKEEFIRVVNETLEKEPII